MCSRRMKSKSRLCIKVQNRGRGRRGELEERRERESAERRGG